MAATHLHEADLLDALRSPFPADALDRSLGGAVAVQLAGRPPPPDLTDLVEAVVSLPCVIVGVGDADDTLAPLCDVVVAADDDTLAALLRTIDANPQASSTLALLLRGTTSRSTEAGLVAESAAYSTLQSGPEFAAWRAATPVRARPDHHGPVVRTERDDGRLVVTLSRPEVHNAFDARMRDELVDALALGRDDPSVAEVVLAGDGPSFCSGGDLDEFGTRPDPATAHLVRLARSPGRLLAAMSDRVTARLHGACMGSGIELPAFAGRVVAHPDTTIGLPEVGMGLIPGAGGTVSLPRRIGRHRTALLALSCTTIDAAMAARWGLVDAVED